MPGHETLSSKVTKFIMGHYQDGRMPSGEGPLIAAMFHTSRQTVWVTGARTPKRLTAPEAVQRRQVCPCTEVIYPHFVYHAQRSRA